MTSPVAIPGRTSKPRSIGRTQIIDTGQGPAWIDDQLAVCAEWVDLAKFGWGTSVVTPNLSHKLDVYRAHDIDVCFGGTLLELAVLQDRVEEYVGFVKDHGVTTVEVSDGTVSMDTDEKLALIERLAAEFTVMSEVGSKDAAAIVSPVRWVRSIKAELAAGATHIILEGRESGTAGLYRPTGEIRMGLVDEIIESGISPDSLVFEAPHKGQQLWLVEHLGVHVNFGNIHLNDVIAVETLRRGLRGDTLLAIHGS